MAYTPSYNSLSPYSLSNIVNKFMLYYVHRSVPPHELDRVVVINNERYVHRPDLLAADIYGTEDLFWVIPVRNGLQDPIFDLTFGRALFIPDPLFVDTIR